MRAIGIKIITLAVMATAVCFNTVDAKKLDSRTERKICELVKSKRIGRRAPVRSNIPPRLIGTNPHQLNRETALKFYKILKMRRDENVRPFAHEAEPQIHPDIYNEELRPAPLSQEESRRLTQLTQEYNRLTNEIEMEERITLVQGDNELPSDFYKRQQKQERMIMDLKSQRLDIEIELRELAKRNQANTPLGDKILQKQPKLSEY